MKRQCALRLDLMPGEASPAWQIFDRLTGVNGGIARRIPLNHHVDPGNVIASFNDIVVKAINSSNQQLALASLRAWGSSVCKELFPEEILRKLSSYDGGDILFMVPLQWADLPFEILYIPNCFLGERFQIGTIITSEMSQGPEKQYNHRGDLMIITDASEALKSASSEGASLRDAAIKRKRQVRLVMKGDNRKLIEEIPEASIVHFAGHSGPDQQHGVAGWRLSDGNYFDTDDIVKTGTSMVLPWLVFSNSCDGGRIMVNTGLSGITGAFLSAGVHQVVGPYCKLNDQQARCCTMAFYTSLFKGNSVAQALKSLRKNRPDGAGITPLFYRLFGDPRYTEQKNKKALYKIAPLLTALTFVLFLSGVGLKLLHDKMVMNDTAVVAESNGKKFGKPEFAIDLSLGNFMHFSITTYAPTVVTFIDKDPAVKKISEERGDSLTIINDTLKDTK